MNPRWSVRTVSDAAVISPHPGEPARTQLVVRKRPHLQRYDDLYIHALRSECTDTHTRNCEHASTLAQDCIQIQRAA